jgi:hypothetical protein
MQDAREPLSWLILERYALGELSPDQRKDVELRLADSEADRACLAEIMADQSELPPLARVSAISSARRRMRPWLGWSAALCAAAAALLVVLRQPASDDADLHVKGADVALRLVSDRQGADPTHFTAGERFKVQVTCPPTLSGSLRVLVAQGAEVSEPLARDAGFRCGNLAPWPGAFALDGAEPAEVCAYWGSKAQPDAAELARAGVCRRLSSP